MNKWALFQKFLITENSQININHFLINSLVLIVITVLLELTYYKCANSLSNKKLFAKNFILTAFTTMVIISIVKSSLALSLGLVGALSIVRFRTAIKEPEELAYLFFTIAIGLGLGAEQTMITVISSVILLAIIWGRFFISNRKNEVQNLFLTISENPKKNDFNEVKKIVDSFFKRNKLKRYTENESLIECSFYVDVKDNKQLSGLKQELYKLNDKFEINFIDNNA